MAKDAYYFFHDSNAKDDPKCVMLIEQLGLEGYGIYWVLIETLRDQPEYKYPMALVPALARRYNTTVQKVEAVIGAYGLFVVDENNFFSLSLIERMHKLEAKREQARQAGLKSGQRRRISLPEIDNKNQTGVERTFNGSSTDDELVEKSRVEDSKVDLSKRDQSEQSNSPFSSYEYSIVFGYNNKFVDITGQHFSAIFIDYFNQSLKSGIDAELIWDALLRSAEKQNPFTYARSIVENWKAEGITKLSQLKAKENKNKGGQAGAGTNKQDSQQPIDENDTRLAYQRRWPETMQPELVTASVPVSGDDVDF